MVLYICDFKITEKHPVFKIRHQKKKESKIRTLWDLKILQNSFKKSPRTHQKFIGLVSFWILFKTPVSVPTKKKISHIQGLISTSIWSETLHEI